MVELTAHHLHKNREAETMSHASKGTTQLESGAVEAQPKASPSPASGRDLIDARGSIDSRTFNEEGRISSIAKDKRDRHAPSAESDFSKTRWRSHSGGVGFSGGVLSGGADYGKPQKQLSEIPPFFKIAIPIIAILLIVVVALAFF